MSLPVIESGATLGVLGGGQLGAMFATAARRMGYGVAVWDPDADAPAHRMADYSLMNPFLDLSACHDFLQRVRAVIAKRAEAWNPYYRAPAPPPEEVSGGE